MNRAIKHHACAALLLGFAALQIPDSHAAPPSAWDGLRFLEGSWEARTQGGAANAQGTGSYSFVPELKHHLLVRRSYGAEGCQGPADFDCEHGDVLFVYEESGALKAIYFDNEGHVIHYSVTTPDPATAVFVSAPSAAGPQFQLLYQLKGDVMSGKFQTRTPGQSQWQSYLEWSGRARPAPIHPKR